MKSQKKEVANCFATSFFMLKFNNSSYLILKEVLNLFVRNHLLVEDVSTSLGALHHLDYLCVSATIL